MVPLPQLHPHDGESADQRDGQGNSDGCDQTPPRNPSQSSRGWNVSPVTAHTEQITGEVSRPWGVARRRHHGTLKLVNTTNIFRIRDGL